MHMGTTDIHAGTVEAEADLELERLLWGLLDDDGLGLCEPTGEGRPLAEEAEGKTPT
jgi:hypothetical protein